ncbi:hypothetical protein [Novilysobacter spongiicola]|uniref:hypothetical protein n=1 Tax=Novilysobacter spongiicola TaxID=435289 RepID=UPI00117E0081|nr:hypothetical protein [Lysobacter spongiicola]
MAALKTTLKILVVLFVVYLVGGTLLENHFEKAQQDRCAALEQESNELLPHLVIGNLMIRGPSISGRLSNNSHSHVYGEAVFNVAASDCIGSGCSVVGRGNYFARNVSIPPGEARDFIATATGNEIQRISPQGQMQYAVELTTVNWGRQECYF